MTIFKDGFATKNGDVLAYTFDLSNGELLGHGLVHVSEGCGLSPGQVLDSPPEPDLGFAVVRDGARWRVVEDHRGTLYSIESGVPVEHELLGPLPDGMTSKPRPHGYYRWSDGEWEPDVEAAAADEQKRSIAEAIQYLAATDWYVTRKMESGKAIPPDIASARTAARIKANG